MAIKNSCTKNLYAPASSSYYYTFTASFEEIDYSIATNISQLKIDGSIYGYHIGFSGTGGNFKVYWYDDYLNKDGQLVIDKDISTLTKNTTKSYSKNIEVTHKEDGKLSGYVKFVWERSSSNSYVPESGEKQCSNTPLTTIPRASTCSCPNFNIGDSVNIQVSSASSEFRHKLRYQFGSLNQVIAENVVSSYLWTPDKDSFLNQIPDSISEQGTLYCITYDSEGNQVGSEQSSTFTAQVKDYNTEITEYSFIDKNSKTVALTGNEKIMIPEFSNVEVITIYTIGNKATLKEYKVSCGNQSSSDNPYIFNNASSNIFNFTLVDSRNKNLKEEQKQQEMNKVDYIPLAFTNIVCDREEETSDKVKLSFDLNFFGNNFGVENNTIEIYWQYQLQGSSDGSSSWSELEEITIPFEIPCTNLTYSATLNSTFDYEKAYNIRLIARDKLKELNEIIPISKGVPLIDKGENFVDVHGELCAYDFQLFNENGEYKSIFEFLYPKGSLYLTTNEIKPSILFGGTWELYGKGKALVGYDENDTDFDTIGKTGGSKEMQSHTHTGTTDSKGNHKHVLGGNANSIASGSSYARPRGYSSGVLETTYDTSEAGEHSHTLTINNSGKGDSGNLQPYIVVYIWRRTA